MVTRRQNALQDRRIVRHLSLQRDTIQDTGYRIQETEVRKSEIHRSDRELYTYDTQIRVFLLYRCSDVDTNGDIHRVDTPHECDSPLCTFVSMALRLELVNESECKSRRKD